MKDLGKVMDSMDQLSVSLKKIERYNFLSYLTGRMIISVLLFLAAALFAYILISMNDFQDINPYLGTIRTTGAADFGTFLNLFTIISIIGAIIVYITTVKMNKRAMSTRNWEAEVFDRTKGGDELLGAITRIDWAKARNELKMAKLSYVLYNASIVGIYSFLLYFVLQFLFVFAFRPLIEFILLALRVFVSLHTIYTYVIISAIAVLISVFILRKELRKSALELRELDTMLSELRWFLNEFEESGLPT